MVQKQHPRIPLSQPKTQSAIDGKDASSCGFSSWPCSFLSMQCQGADISPPQLLASGSTPQDKLSSPEGTEALWCFP